jgi:hypothetical protein
VGNIHFAKTSAEQNQNIQTFIEWYLVGSAASSLLWRVVGQ